MRRWVGLVLLAACASAAQTLEDALRLNREATAAYQRGEVDTAAARCLDALAIYERLAPDSLEVANVLSDLGIFARARGDLDSAQAFHSRALAIRERVAPDSPAVVASLNSLGYVAHARGDLDSAQEHHTRALAVAARLGPDSLDVAQCFYNLGTIAFDRGDLQTTQDYAARALAIRERLAPDSLLLARSLQYVGAVANARGDYDMARETQLRARLILERLAPDSLDLATVLCNLAVLADGDLDAAHEYYKRALAIEERFTTETLRLAGVLRGLGGVEHARGALDAAEDFLGRALAISQRVAPGSLDVAQSLIMLGGVAGARGELDAAQDYYTRALAIHDRLAPNSLAVAASLINLGGLAGGRNDHVAARDCYTRALAINERLAPDSLQTAYALSAIAGLDARHGDVAEAVRLSGRALTIVEQQRGLVAGDEARALLAENSGWLYRVRLLALLLAGDIPAAFATLERSRARSLVDALAERHLDFAADSPSELRERKDRLDQQLGAAHRELGRLNPTIDTTRIEELGATIRTLGVQQRELEAEIRRASPMYASLQFPEPLGTAGVQATLDPGTLLLGYQLGEDASHLFALTDDALDHFTLPLAEQAVREKVGAFRRLCSQPRRSPAAAGRELYDELLRPAQARIDAAERLLICADGPLHTLPFAALVTSREGQPIRYLIEDVPLHSIASATVYQQLRQDAKPPAAAPTLLAFGDPSLAGAAQPTQVATTRTYQRQSLDELTPLPFARQEVESLGALFGERARVLVGPAASEAALKAAPIDADVVHLACHGFYFEEHPLDSALVLAPGGDDDGLLQVWEIFEKVKLNADLVVLSACETALGREQKFEGLVGLTRAFQYAGARSVIVSQWRVSDETTVDLMAELYKQRAAGATKDEALRAAQISLIRSERQITSVPVSHPYFWSAFTLVGDWR